MENLGLKNNCFEIIIIIWGEEFVGFFLDILLPNYLSKNNIPICSKLFNLKLKIYTTKKQEERIKQHFHFKLVTSYIEAKIISIIDDKINLIKNKWDIKAYCQTDAVHEGIKNKSILLLFNPDSLISDGFIKKTCELAQKHKVIEILEFARSDKTKISKLLLEKFYDKKTHAITLSNRELVKIGIKNQLSYVKYLSFDKSLKKFAAWPSILYWQYSKNSLLAKSFHLHPISIDLREIKNKQKQQGMFFPDDGGLIEHLGFKRKDIYVETDTDELVSIETSMKETINAGIIFPVKKKSIYIAKWAKLYCFPFHINNFLKYTFHFHYEEKISKQKELSLISNLTVLKIFLSLLMFKGNLSACYFWLKKSIKDLLKIN